MLLSYAKYYWKYSYDFTAARNLNECISVIVFVDNRLLLWHTWSRTCSAYTPELIGLFPPHNLQSKLQSSIPLNLRFFSSRNRTQRPNSHLLRVLKTSFVVVDRLFLVHLTKNSIRSKALWVPPSFDFPFSTTPRSSRRSPCHHTSISYMCLVDRLPVSLLAPPLGTGDIPRSFHSLQNQGTALPTPKIEPMHVPYYELLLCRKPDACT